MKTTCKRSSPPSTLVFIFFENSYLTFMDIPNSLTGGFKSVEYCPWNYSLKYVDIFDYE